jgi:protein LSM14
MPYPPPPGWFPPGQGFPPGAPGPGPWNNYPYPPGPPGPAGTPGLDPSQNNRSTPNPTAPQDQKQVLIGGTADKQKGPGAGAQAPAPTEPKSFAQSLAQNSGAPPPPVESKPSLEEVKATGAYLSTNGQSSKPAGKPVPTGPRNNRVTPVIPLPGGLPKAAPQTAETGGQSSSKVAGTNASNLRDATQAAKAAVAVAMAKLESANTALVNGPMDNLTKKVNEMRVNATRGNNQGARGRGRGGRPGQAKVEVPDSDFDFASSNAKFNKHDLVKEVIAGSPLTETPNGSVSETTEPTSTPATAYNKTTSFFDNISSEAKERADNGGQKPGGREWRGEEQRKNMETFGQGSVDGGYRNFRGRGRGRGGSRGRGYGGQRGGRGGFRNRDQGTSAAPAQ